MNITVMMTSGDEDVWENAADAVDDRGALVVLYRIEGDEIPEDMKIMQVVQKVDQGPDTPPMEKGETYQVAATYAPGMWMKVEFEQ